MGLPKVFPFLSLSHFTWPLLKQGGGIFKVLRAGEVLPNFLNNISAFRVLCWCLVQSVLLS
jgi:hypothetical protein